MPSPVYGASGGSGGTLALQTPTGAVNGVNTAFVFADTPILVMRNGIPQSPDVYTIVGTTVTFDTAPDSGEITGLTQ